MIPKTAKTLYAKLLAFRPGVKTELGWNTPFQLLIAVILSAQATDVSVNAATKVLFAKAGDAQAILSLGEAGLLTYIRTIGLAPTKARNIIRTCHMLLADHQGQPPNTREALERLPGVGRKTANVVLNVAFGQPTIAVDTHVFRVSNRTGLAPGKTPLAVERALLDITPKAYLQAAHHTLILHGRYLCKARKPLCAQCPILTECENVVHPPSQPV